MLDIEIIYDTVLNSGRSSSSSSSGSGMSKSSSSSSSSSSSRGGVRVGVGEVAEEEEEEEVVVVVVVVDKTKLLPVRLRAWEGLLDHQPYSKKSAALPATKIGNHYKRSRVAWPMVWSLYPNPY